MFLRGFGIFGKGLRARTAFITFFIIIIVLYYAASRFLFFWSIELMALSLHFYYYISFVRECISRARVRDFGMTSAYILAGEWFLFFWVCVLGFFSLVRVRAARIERKIEQSCLLASDLVVSSTSSNSPFKLLVVLLRARGLFFF